MEKTYIQHIENGIRGIRLGTKLPNETKVGHYLNKLKPLNEGLYIDLLEKYKRVIEDSKNRK